MVSIRRPSGTSVRRGPRDGRRRRDPSQACRPFDRPTHESLERHGFRLRATDRAFIEQTRVVPVVHATTGLPADLVLAGPGLEEDFLGRAIEHNIEGVEVPVASPEDLVVMKILAGRPKDFEDVVAILSARERDFDLALARGTLEQLEEALGQSDLVPLLDKAIVRARRGAGGLREDEGEIK
jgi:hypothetical protein